MKATETAVAFFIKKEEVTISLYLNERTIKKPVFLFAIHVQIIDNTQKTRYSLSISSG